MREGGETAAREKAEEEAKRKAEESKVKAVVDRKKAAEEAKRKAEEERIQAAETARKRKKICEIHLSDARHSLSNNEFEKAKIEAQKVLETDPGNRDARQILNEIPKKEAIYRKTQEKGKTEEAARERTQKAAEHVKEARARVGARDFQGAREEARKALGIDRANIPAKQLLKEIDRVEKEHTRNEKTAARGKGKPEGAAATAGSIWVSAAKGMGLDKLGKKEAEPGIGREPAGGKEKKPALDLGYLSRSKKEVAAGGKKFDIKKIKKSYIYIMVGILIGALVLSHTVGKIKQVFFKEREDAKEGQEFAETIPVKVYKVKRMDFKDTLPVLGRIEGFKQIELRLAESGILESYNFEEGERILEGDIIASLDQKDALLKLKYASIEMEKAQRLLELGGIEKAGADQKKLEYESAKRDLEKTNIYASSDGYLGSKETHTGAYVTPQDKIGTFVDFSEVYASFDVIEEDSPKVKLGQNAEIFLDAYPGTSYKGTIDMIAPMIEGRTRTQKVKIEITNENDEFRPGMFARAILNTYEKADALIIPASAFKKVENKYLVYVVHPEEEEAVPLEEVDGVAEDAAEAGSETGIVEEREIKIEYLTHDVAEVGKGLNEGELIIRELHQEYKDKDKVEITEIQETIF